VPDPGIDTTSDRRPLVGVGAMIWRDGKVLLGRRQGSHGAATWGWCGGHLEFGETPEACATREIFEEAGLCVRVEDLKPLCVHNVVADGHHYVDIEFWTDRSSGEPEIKEPSKVESWDWFTLDRLPDRLFEPVRLAIAAWSSGRWYGRSSNSSRGFP
jgi:8-oxo-dGTP diphosphatase